MYVCPRTAGAASTYAVCTPGGVQAWATGNKEACAAWGERWVASMTILVGDGYSVKEKLAVLTHGFRARQAQGDSEAAPSDEPSKQAAAEPQPKEEEVD